ncbi:hypothetical protein MMC30_007570 [Trapelia coarctata]|nr:hypothetical protein [Trapelia coarctata]
MAESAAIFSPVCHFLRLPLELRLIIYRFLLLESPECSVQRNSGIANTRSLSILRTNHQIYKEAANVLYSEVDVNLELDGIVCLQETPVCSTVTAHKQVWRHNPLFGVGQCSDGGRHDYEPPELAGFLEPHIFARFRRVSFNAWFNFIDAADASEPPIRSDEHCNLSAKDEIRLAEFLQKSMVLEHFAQIMSNSLLVDNLVISLNVSIDLPEKADTPTDDDVSMLLLKIHGRAMEVLINNGLLSPLGRLANVRSFEFEFWPAGPKGQSYVP